MLALIRSLGNLVMISVAKTIRFATSDRRPMAETDLHRNQMVASISCLEMRYADDPNVYVSGNLLLYVERLEKGFHVLRAELDALKRKLAD
jgi:hypothetical protein